ncbi:MAG: lipopolysaccharide kinase InaA family protein [Desulfobacterales bacterium]
MLNPEWQNLAGLEDFCLNIEERAKDPQGRVMKDDSAARVVAVGYNPHCLVIKQYNSKSGYKAISRSVRKSKAEKTWNNARYLRQEAIDTVEPVALVEDRLGFFRIRSFFVGVYIAGQEARSFFNDPSNTFPELSAAAEKIVESIFEFHSRGIFLGDTKDTNIVIRSERVYWVDLDALTVPGLKWIADRKRSRDWKIFFHNWRNNEAVRQLFLELVRQRMSTSEWQNLAALLAFHAKKKFSPQSILCRSGMGRANPWIMPPQLEKAAKGSDVAGWEKVQSAATAVVLRKETEYGGLYCKVFLPRNRLEKIKRVLRAGRGERSVKNEYMMRAAGFRVPETICWERQGGNDYTVSREVEGVKLVSWLDMKGHDCKYRRMVLKKLGETVGDLHMAGFSHGDLRLNNIIIQEYGKEPRFFFLDNERTRLYRKIPRKEIVKNLRQINTDAVSRLTNTDRLRIFKAYEKASGGFKRSREKRMLEEIEKKTIKRHAKSGRSVKSSPAVSP